MQIYNKYPDYTWVLRNRALKVLHDMSAEAPPGGSAEPQTKSASAVNFMAGNKKKACWLFTRELEGHQKDMQTQFITFHSWNPLSLMKRRMRWWRACHARFFGERFLESESPFILTDLKAVGKLDTNLTNLQVPEHKDSKVSYFEMQVLTFNVGVCKKMFTCFKVQNPLFSVDCSERGWLKVL